MINENYLILELLPIKNQKMANANLIVHNVGGGQVLEDCLFSYKIVGIFNMENNLKINQFEDLKIEVTF